MEDVKGAFLKVKEDIDYIWNYTLNLEEKIDNLEKSLVILTKKIDELLIISSYNQKDTNPTIQHIIPTHNSNNPTHNSKKELFKPLKASDPNTSTGNEGVPTDRQTDRQTTNTSNLSFEGSYNLKNNQSINQVSNLVGEIEFVKRNLISQLRGLTDQEFLVFSMIYQFDDSLGYADYKIISDKLKLSESSIRDYVGRLIKKGIPVEKEKLNNKQVILHVSSDFKKISPLNQLISFR